MSPSEQQELESLPGIYQHYKGEFYQVLGTSVHSESLERLVLYRSLKGSAEFAPETLWVRPYAMFNGNVTVDGRTVKRFTKISAESSEHLTEDEEFLPAYVAWMKEALDLAKEAMKLGEVPIASVIARRESGIIGRGWNEQNAKRDRSSHAEINAIRDAAGRYPEGAEDLILISTLEPCVMCYSCALLTGISTIVYALEAPADSGSCRVITPDSSVSIPRVMRAILRQDSRQLFQDWFQNNQHLAGQQTKYIAQLLLLTESSNSLPGG